MSKRNYVGKHLYGAIFAVITIVVALAGLSRLVVPKNNTGEAGMHDPWALGILGEPDDSIDVFILGDSEAHTAFSPLRMWGEAGFTSYASGTSNQEMCYGNVILLQATARQHPRVVVIETNELFRRFSLSTAMVKDFSYLFPVFEYHDRWKQTSWAELTTEIAYTSTEPYHGYQLRWGEGAAENEDYMEEDEDEGEIPEHISCLNRLYLRRMVDYCHEIGAVPVLVSAPSPKNMSAARHRAIEQIAEELRVDYLDLNEHVEDIGLDWQVDTYDGGDHVNLVGAQKNSVYLAHYLSEAYDLPDHRHDESYALWADQYESYHDEYGEYGG